MEFHGQCSGGLPRRSILVLILSMSLTVGALFVTGGSLHAKDFDNEFQADELPTGFDVNYNRYTIKDVPWVAATLTNALKPQSQVAVAITKQAMPTHAHRVAAAKAYINGVASSLAKTGFKLSETKIPDPENLDWTKKQVFQFKYANDSDQELLCVMLIWFSADAGYSGAAFAPNTEELKPLFEWVTSVQTPPGVDGGAMRTWTSTKGHQVEASLRWVNGDLLRIRRKDGVDVDVRIDQLSEADKEFIARSNKLALQLNSDKHGISMTLPTGFSPSTPRAKDMMTFRNLEGTAIDIGIASWPEDKAADVRELLSSIVPANASISPLPDARQETMVCDFQVAPEQPHRNRGYATRLNDAAVVIIVEASPASMEGYRKLLDASVRTIRSTK